jgi:F0F1-type ATP synthase alpha subunit
MDDGRGTSIQYRKMEKNQSERPKRLFDHKATDRRLRIRSEMAKSVKYHVGDGIALFMGAENCVASDIEFPHQCMACVELEEDNVGVALS